MPIYAYRCRKCGSEEEHIQRMSDPPMTKCEACGGKLERLVSPAAFHLKGGGWYRDGYASSKPDSGGGGESKESSSSSSGESKTETSTEKKKDKKEKASAKKESKAAKVAS